MNLRFQILPAFALGLLCAAQARAEITLPKILSSHMVVQRDLPVHVWGMATPGERVAATFRGETESTTASELGRWSLYLNRVRRAGRSR